MSRPSASTVAIVARAAAMSGGPFSLAVGASLSKAWLRRYVASIAKARIASSGVA